ncbi:transmembrane protein 128 isoform X1 [Bos indicus]|uniref:Transmembrane protein 128 n=2 Tax=Bos TaxID=9903 RepID=A0AAF6YL67_BOVIN|nr:transmembrane protein 128 isoform X1 [Bos taurus]XP_019818652.1 PREDICTED: transmembrane protein 128 isoform X1 [Bos indicus]XP_061276793.1 transmembrane protein 128 isoform X1 [Bos javanicus]
MDVLRAREQLRRRYLFPQDAEVPLEHEGYPRPETSTAVEKKEKPLPRLNIHSGFWILASIVVTYYVDFFQTVKENFHTSSWFLFGSALLLVSVSIAFYCIVYLEWYRGIEDYDIKYPALIPITTATFIVAGICQRWRSSIQSAKTRPGADCGSDHELLIAKFRLKLKKVGKTTRPFSFNVALWHVWSFFTPVLLFTQFMGVVMLTSLLG